MPIVRKAFSDIEITVDPVHELNKVKHMPRKDWYVLFSTVGKARVDELDTTYLRLSDEIIRWIVAEVEKEADRQDASTRYVILITFALAALAALYVFGCRFFEKKSKKWARENLIDQLRQVKKQEPEVSNISKSNVQRIKMSASSESEFIEDSNDVSIEEEVKPSFTKHSHKMTTGKSGVTVYSSTKKGVASKAPIAGSSNASTSPVPSLSLKIKIQDELRSFLLSDLKQSHHLPGDHSYQGYPKTLFAMFWPNTSDMAAESEKITKMASKHQSGVVLYSSAERGKNGYDAKLKLLGAQGKGDIRYLATLHKAIGYEKQYGVLLFSIGQKESHKSLQRMKKK